LCGSGQAGTTTGACFGDFEGGRRPSAGCDGLDEVAGVDEAADGVELAAPVAAQTHPAVAQRLREDPRLAFPDAVQPFPGAVEAGRGFARGRVVGGGDAAPVVRTVEAGTDAGEPGLEDGEGRLGAGDGPAEGRGDVGDRVVLRPVVEERAEGPDVPLDLVVQPGAPTLFDGLVDEDLERRHGERAGESLDLPERDGPAVDARLDVADDGLGHAAPAGEHVRAHPEYEAPVPDAVSVDADHRATSTENPTRSFHLPWSRTVTASVTPSRSPSTTAALMVARGGRRSGIVLRGLGGVVARLTSPVPRSGWRGGSRSAC